MSLEIGNEIFRCKYKPKAPIIEGILNEQDFLVIVGASKAGKSIVAQQMAMAISGSKYFMEDHKVHTNGDVVYAQFEGDRGEMKQRFIDMEKAVETERCHLAHFHKKGLKLNSDAGFENFVTAIDSAHFNPKVIVIDPLYRAFKADICKQTDVNKICDVVDELKARYNCAIIMTHHTGKESFDKNGNPIDRGDGASYGSEFLRANVDTMMMLNKVMETRVLTCSTQRSGKIIDRLDFNLVAPTQDPDNPLHFVKTGSSAGTPSRKIELLFQKKNEPLSQTAIAEKIGCHKNTVNKAIKQFIRQDKIGSVREGKFVKYYWREGRERL